MTAIVSIEIEEPFISEFGVATGKLLRGSDHIPQAIQIGNKNFKITYGRYLASVTLKKILTLAEYDMFFESLTEEQKIHYEPHYKVTQALPEYCYLARYSNSTVIEKVQLTNTRTFRIIEREARECGDGLAHKSWQVVKDYLVQQHNLRLKACEEELKKHRKNLHLVLSLKEPE